MAPPVLDDFSFQYMDDGVTLNPNSTNPPFVDVTRVAGLDSAPTRVTSRPSEGRDGGVVEADYRDIRTIAIEGRIFYATEDYLDTLKANFAPVGTAQPLYLKAPGVDQRVLFCKSTGFKYDWETARRISIVEFQIQLLAGDGNLYSGDESVVVGTLPSGANPGRFYNRTYPLTYGGVIDNGALIVRNDGNKDAPALITLTGPVTNPRITHDNTGNRLELLMTVGPSDYLEIDLGRRSIMLNGTANRRPYLTSSSRWFLLEPGNNQLRYSAAAATTSTMTVTFRHTWE
jgi:hypothetical protein